MGIWDAITELVEAATPWAVAEAEAPAKEEDSKDESAETKDDSEDAEGEDKDEGGEDGGDEEGGEGGEEEEEEEAEEEEDDEEEIVDPKETLEEECRNSQKCASVKHHYEECAERVANGSKEDCVEEFFHLTHCATQCAAGKLWSKLK